MCPDAGDNSDDNCLANSDDTCPALQSPTQATSYDLSCSDANDMLDVSYPMNPGDTRPVLWPLTFACVKMTSHHPAHDRRQPMQDYLSSEENSQVTSEHVIWVGRGTKS